MCDKAVADCFAALKFIPDWFFISKMLGKFHDALLAKDDMLFSDEDFSKFTFSANEMGVLSVDLNKINLDDDNNFIKMILKLLFLSDFCLVVTN